MGSAEPEELEPEPETSPAQPHPEPIQARAARDIERIVSFVQTCEYLSPTEKKVIVNRLWPGPTPVEIKTALAQLEAEQIRKV